MKIKTLFSILIISIFSSCGLFEEKLTDIKIVYHGNGHTSGSVPIDNNRYDIDDIIIPMQSEIKKDGYELLGWSYVQYAQEPKEEIILSYASIDSDNTIHLNAVWSEKYYILNIDLNLPDESSIPIQIHPAEHFDTYFSIAYPEGNSSHTDLTDLNDITYGSFLMDVKIDEQELNSGYVISEWNSKADGSGQRYYCDTDYIFEDYDNTIYAIWEEATPGLSYTLRTIPEDSSNDSSDFLNRSDSNHPDYHYFEVNPHTVNETIDPTLEPEKIITDVIVPSSYWGTDILALNSDHLYSNNNDQNLLNVALPEGLLGLKTATFAETNIETIILPESLRFIGQECFIDSDITSIVIPKNVTTIYYSALFTPNLVDIYMQPGIAPTLIYNDTTHPHNFPMAFLKDTGTLDIKIPGASSNPDYDLGTYIDREDWARYRTAFYDYNAD